MKYFWTSAYNTGVFLYWKIKDGKDFLPEVRKHYSDTNFDFGETSQASYEKAVNKGN